MTNIHTPDLDYTKTIEILRSLGNKDLVESAKSDLAIGKEAIIQSSHLELSGLESEQAYSASMSAGLDMLNTLSLRRDWSEYIKQGFYCMVGVQVLIIPVLLALMFLRPEITFDKITTIIYVVIGENFVQMIGLVIVVVKFLFPPDMPARTKE